MTLERVQAGASLLGIDGEGLAEVLAARWIGQDALDVAYRVNGQTRSRMLLRSDEEGLRTPEGSARAFALDGDGASCRAGLWPAVRATTRHGP